MKVKMILPALTEWDLVIRAKRAGMMLPALETILSEFGKRSTGAVTRDDRMRVLAQAGEPKTLHTTSAPLLQVQRRLVAAEPVGALE